MINKLPLTVAYLRISKTEESTETLSLDYQKHKIESYCEVKDLKLVKIIEDAGKSGKNLNRPGIIEIMGLVKSKQIDSVCVYRLDRLTRRTKDLLYLVEDVFNKNNVAFYSLNENIDTTSASGKFFLTLMGALAQMERDLIGERTQDALQELKRQNRRLGNPDMVPYGFRQIRRKRATITDLVPIPDKIACVKKIFELRKRKQSLEKIGKQFSLAKSSVKYILDNPFYANYSFS